MTQSIEDLRAELDALERELGSDAEERERADLSKKIRIGRNRKLYKDCVSRYGKQFKLDLLDLDTDGTAPATIQFDGKEWPLTTLFVVRNMTRGEQKAFDTAVRDKMDDHDVIRSAQFEAIKSCLVEPAKPKTPDESRALEATFSFFGIAMNTLYNMIVTLGGAYNENERKRMR